MFLLVVMVYDRYMAICKPLPYLMVMNKWVCVLLLLLAWVGDFLHATVKLLLVYNLPFCGLSVSDHFVCDMYPLLKLACTDTYIVGVTVIFNDGTICVVIFMIILISYGVILKSLKNLIRKGSAKPYPPVAPTSLWWSSSLYPVFLCTWDLLLAYPLINPWLYFTLSPLCWTP